MFRIAHRAAIGARIRLIAPERPGFGLSTRHPGRNLASYALDMAEFANALGIERFAVAGISGGGPYAAACAAFLGERITALTLVSPVGPFAGTEKPRRIGAGHYFAFRIVPRIPPLSALICAFGRFAFLNIPDLMYAFILSRCSKSDWAVLKNEDVKQNLLGGVAEGFRPSVRATMQELGIFSRPWHIPFEKISAPALLWQGMNDRNIPVAAALRLGALIPNCSVRQVPQAGHYWIFDNMATVFDATNIAAKSGQPG